MKADIDTLLRAADEAVRFGRKGVAQERWEQVLKIEREHPVALNGLGMLALQNSKVAPAVEYFRRAAEAQPDATILWLNYAKAARLLGDDEAEKDSLLRAAEVEPVSLIINIRLAENAERVGDSTAAIERWRAVVTIADNLPEIPAEAAAAIEHGRAILAQVTAALSARIDDALRSARLEASVQERRRIDAAVDNMFGRRAIYLNQCSGLYIPFLPSDEYFDRALFPWLAELEAATQTIQGELLADRNEGGAGFEPYVSLPPGSPQNIWSALDRSTNWSTLHFWRYGKRDDQVCARFPRTSALIDSLPLMTLGGSTPNVLFSVLAPGAHIPPHTGVTNARTVIHLPLIVPPDCRFRVGGETRKWVEGEAFAFDDTIEHEAWNDSDLPRTILILDTWNPYLSERERDMLVAFHQANGQGLTEA